MKREDRGFTLIEVLASTVIGSIVLLLAVASLRTTGNEYGRNTDGVAAERESRAVLTLVAEDLSKASAYQNLKIETSSDGWRQDKLGFTCLQPADAQAKDEAIGDLCLVYYYMKDLEIGNETVRCLMRGFRASDVVFESLRNDRIDSLYSQQAQDEPVAFGVLAFEAEGLVRQKDGSWKTWDKVANDPTAESPNVVKLRLVVARRELASKLRTSDDWDNSPLIGDPEKAERSELLGNYEITHPFGHAR